MNSQQTPAAHLKGVEAELRGLARTIDPTLRKHFANRRLRSLLRPLKSPAERRQAVSFRAPSRLSWLVMFLVALPGLAVQFKLVRVPLVNQWLAYLPDSIVALPYFSSWPIIVGLVLAWLCEYRLLPWAFFVRYRFRLMRMEENTGEGEHPYVFTTADVGDRKTGFGTQTWSAARGVEPGNIIISVSNSKNHGVAMILLRIEGRLPVIVWPRDLFQENVFRPLNPAIKALALRFADACDQHHAIAADLERARALRSDQPVSRQAGSNAKGKSEVSAAPPPPLPDLDAVWADLSIADELKDTLIETALHFADGSPLASRGLLLYGPPGTGKTLIAKALAETIACGFFPVSLPDLKAETIGSSGQRVKELWEKALAEPRAVLFIDECEGVFGRRGSVNTDRFAEDIVNAFLAQWDGIAKQSTVWVVGATNRRDLIDPAVRSRFGEEIEIGLPDAEQRVAILTGELQRLRSSARLPARAEQLTQGMSGRDLVGIVKKILRENGLHDPISDEVLEKHTRAFRQQGSTGVDETAVWQRLVLAEATLRELQKTAAMLRNAETLNRQGTPAPRGLLLYGPPGTGKTQIARTLATESGLRFISVSTADLKKGWIGHSGQAVRETFERAREAAPAVLFIDEIDIVAGDGSGHIDTFKQEILGQLLQEMDGIARQTQHVFVLAATNHVDRIDSALLSRFAKKIEVPLPDSSGVRRLLQVMLAGKPIGFGLDDGSEQLAEFAGVGKSGRDLQQWVEQAVQNAVLRAIERGQPDKVKIDLADFGMPTQAPIA